MITRSTHPRGKITLLFMAAPAALLALTTIESAMAQNAVPDGYRSPDLLTKPYLTPTGQVVPKPGQSQSGPQTEAERKAQKQSDQILNSICSNC
jgi:hypothetical protein